ncbi:MAG: hypothetical protein ACO21U_09060 [bacterium]|jgi:hypothetical protein
MTEMLFTKIYLPSEEQARCLFSTGACGLVRWNTIHKDLEALVGSRKRHYLANPVFCRCERCMDAEYGE